MKSNFKNEIQKMSWKEFQEVAQQYPFRLPRIFTMIDDEMMLAPSDISELVGVKTETVRNWCRQGKLRIISPIGRYMIQGDDLKEFMFERFKNDFLEE